MTQNERTGSNVKLYREKLGLTQEALASYLGITRSEMNYYENGKRAFPTQILNKCAKLFGIDDYDLYEENQENLQANVALAFRADYLNADDLNHIADFRKIVLNYLKMKKHPAQ